MLVALAWGVNFVVIDVGLETFPPILFVALRFAFIAFPAVFFVPLPDVRAAVVVAVGLFVCVGQFGLLFVAMHRGVPAGLASLILQLQAVFTILLAAGLLHERPRLHQLTGVAVAIGGIGVIAAGRAQSVPLTACGLCVLAAASWGAGNVVTRWSRTRRPLSLLVWSSVAATPALAALSLGLEGSSSWGDAASSFGASPLLSLAYVVLVATFFGFGVWTWLLSRHAASSVAPFTLLVPVTSIASAWLARGERPGVLEVVGAAIVLLGLALVGGVFPRQTMVRRLGWARTSRERAIRHVV